MREQIIIDRPAKIKGVARITLNRPDKRNALSIALRDEITAAVGEICTDKEIKCILFTGAGTMFCAGFDLEEFALMADPKENERLWASSDRFHHALIACPLPTIAAINGGAYGGGMDLATMCDIRIAGSDARFGHPEQAFGDVLFGPLHDAVAGSHARYLALTGRKIDAQTALRMGLINEIAEPDVLHDAALAIAADVCRAPREMLMRTKRKAIERAGIELMKTVDI